ncbi:hypothetical protein K7I13_01465 [Brucepastera parasyntrophica]|nr:hypothetical protein [Brucepastera parasyntrophica]ULQ60029.1 hypothetical protein K7I13_01465 [Brucepastera parasyntrophica]
MAADCAIPSRLQRMLRKSSPLLQSVSPSRLTEELLKIINSGRAYATICSALQYDLYMYLQPSANSLIDDDPGYAESYEKSLLRLDELVAENRDLRTGQKLVYLLYDFIQRITKWDDPPSEVYRTVYAECRRFILPMNPPRVELEYAVRWCLKDGGLNIKVTKPRKKQPDTHTTQGERNKPRAAEDNAAAFHGPRKRRRNRNERPSTESN